MVRKSSVCFIGVFAFSCIYIAVCVCVGGWVWVSDEPDPPSGHMCMVIPYISLLFGSLLCSLLLFGFFPLAIVHVGSLLTRIHNLYRKSINN